VSWKPYPAYKDSGALWRGLEDAERAEFSEGREPRRRGDFAEGRPDTNHFYLSVGGRGMTWKPYPPLIPLEPLQKREFHVERGWGTEVTGFKGAWLHD